MAPIDQTELKSSLAWSPIQEFGPGRTGHIYPSVKPSTRGPGHERAITGRGLTDNK